MTDPMPVTVRSQEKTDQKKTTPARKPNDKSRSQRRFASAPENQTAASTGVSAIQQSQA